MKYGVGIDISKGKSTIAILSIEGEVIKEPFEFYHNQKDLDNLNLLLNNYSKEMAEKYKVSEEEFLNQIGGKDFLKYDLEVRKALEIITK